VLTPVVYAHDRAEEALAAAAAAAWRRDAEDAAQDAAEAAERARLEAAGAAERAAEEQRLQVRIAGTACECAITRQAAGMHANSDERHATHVPSIWHSIRRGCSPHKIARACGPMLQPPADTA